MKRRDFLGLTLLAPMAAWASPWRVGTAPSAGAIATQRPDGAAHHFALAGGQFLLDGQPFRIRSGEMHPARIPRSHWLHRIRMAKAMGLNTIAIYLMWNYLEGEPGVFGLDSGNHDFAAFIRLCQQEGLWVYLRPGPYICGEWNLGGLPAYLLRDPHVRLRHRNDAGYMAAVRRYIGAIAPRIAPCMAAAGGPVLMLQVENEYAMFDGDVGYLEAIRDLWRAHGIDGPFSVSDGWPDLQRRRAYLPGAALGLDGARVPELVQGRQFAREAPVWLGEAYPGWITRWGDQGFAHRDYTSALGDIMAKGYSFNLYVVHGGTNFGLTAGANADDDGSNFQPVITSYDYGAPINERGDATPAYAAFRKVIAAHSAVRPPLPPPAVPQAAFADAMAHPYASLWDNLGDTPRRVARPMSNELLFGQDQGMVLYRKRVPHGRHLRIEGVRDYAMVHVDGRAAGSISRVKHPQLHTSPMLTLADDGDGTDSRWLDILVDSFGHVNFGPTLGDRKGLTGDVHLDGQLLQDWDVYALPIGDRSSTSLKTLKAPSSRPGLFFLAELQVSAMGDSYLDMSAWTKGYVWVNGHLLGRYWHIGPQQRLYCPGEWLRPGSNEVLVLECHQVRSAPIRRADQLMPARA